MRLRCVANHVGLRSRGRFRWRRLLTWKVILLVAAWLLWTAIASGQTLNAPTSVRAMADAFDAEGIYYLRSRKVDPGIFRVADVLNLPVYVDRSGNAILPFPGYRRPVKIESSRLSDHPTIKAMHQEAIRRRGGREIALDEELCQTAQRWANWMARTGRFKHGGGGYSWQIIQRGATTAKGSVTSWMNSKKGHREIVLRSDHIKAGWGHQKSAKGTGYWVGHF